MGDKLAQLYESIGRFPGLQPGGIHVYDGHNHQESVAEREAAVGKQIEPVLRFRRRLEKKGLPVPRMVVGGTPTAGARGPFNKTAPRPTRMAAVACGGCISALYPKWTPTQLSPLGQSLSMTHCRDMVDEQFPGVGSGWPQSKIQRPSPTMRSPVPAHAQAG